MIVLKLALFGLPGSGKNTTTSFIHDYCAERDIPFRHIRLADPLYEAQSTIYKIAGLELDDFYRQDGELLNFLGGYLRKLNPGVLTSRFASRLSDEIASLALLNPPLSVVVCSDLRPADATALKELGFTFLRIAADASICERRRLERGDQTLGSPTHFTELGMEGLTTDYLIENNATLETLRGHVRALMGTLLNDIDRTGDTASGAS